MHRLLTNAGNAEWNAEDRVKDQEIRNGRSVLETLPLFMKSVRSPNSFSDALQWALSIGVLMSCGLGSSM